MCFARAIERKNPGPDPAHPPMSIRGDEENCKAAASTLRKIRTTPDERRPLNRIPRREIPPSSASFETRHRPLAEFPGLPSWEQSVAYRVRFCENKIARQSSGGGKLACSGRVTAATNWLQCQSHRDMLPLVKAKNVRITRADLTQINVVRRDINVMSTARRPLLLLPRNRTEAQECKHYSYSQCHDCFGRKFHRDSMTITCFATTLSEGIPSTRPLN